MKYRRNVDDAYEPIKTIKGILNDTDALRDQRNKKNTFLVCTSDVTLNLKIFTTIL